MQKQLHAIITGRVQGVGYRAAVHKRILLMKVTGYVKNLSDGSVEIVAEGTESQLDDVLEVASDGSFWSSVKHIDKTYKEATGQFTTFCILH